MNAAMPVGADLRPTLRDSADPASNATAVSWSAIFAGAAGAAALSLILLMLGVGLGLSSVSPWSGQGAGVVAFGVSTIAWLTFTQLAASGMGGYLAGRLRSKWANVHTDEVFFRDTAHGFLAWAVATLVTAALLASAITSIVGGGLQAGATVAGSATAVAGAAASTGASAVAKDNANPSSEGMGYFVDSLFRKDAGGAAASPGTDAASAAASSAQPASAPTAEVVRIFANDIRTGTLSPDDARYVGQLVAQRTGLAQADAEKRVTDTFTRVQTTLKNAETQARDAADKARKVSAGGALWIFISLLIGAFVASLAATYGGRARDL